LDEQQLAVLRGELGEKCLDLVELRGGCVGRVWAEGAGGGIGEGAGALGVEVALGGLEVGVAEYVFDARRVELADEQRAGCVTEVVEAQRRELGSEDRATPCDGCKPIL